LGDGVDYGGVAIAAHNAGTGPFFQQVVGE
jgi:hypothetical protein